MVDLSCSSSQAEFGELVGISQQAVSDLVSRGTLTQGESVGNWLHSYCANLREHAAGRIAGGSLDLGAERAALARVQRERIEMQNCVTRRELAPVALLESALATIGRQIAGVLEAIPVNIKRRSNNLTSDDIQIMVEEIAKARNMAAQAQLEMKDADVDGNSESDTEGTEEY